MKGMYKKIIYLSDAVVTSDGPKIQFCKFYRDAKYSFAGSTGSNNTVLQFYWGKEIRTYFGTRHTL